MTFRRLVQRYVNRKSRLQCHCVSHIVEFGKTHNDAETLLYWTLLCHWLHPGLGFFLRFPAVCATGMMRLLFAEDHCAVCDVGIEILGSGIDTALGTGGDD